MKNFLLVGFPNSGKSSIFNILSGKSRKVSNYSGITVDYAIAELKDNKNYPDEQKIKIVDLPGIYNLIPTSLDEAVTVGTLIKLNENIKEFDKVVIVLDSSKLEASLSLALSIKEIINNENILVIINKSDLLSYRDINLKKLEDYLGLKVLICSTINEKETEEKISKFFHNEAKINNKNNIVKSLEITNKSLDLLQKKNEYITLIDEEDAIQKLKKYQLQARYIINEIIGNKVLKLANISYKIDKILLHPILGLIFFGLIFFLIFQSLYTLSAPLMSFLEESINYIGNYVGSFIENKTLKSLVIDGIFAGVGGVIVFLPQIMILFFLLSLLEQSGYISRAAFITDKFMSYFGLNGKAFLPFLSGFACSVPAIMATRTISDKLERMATLMVIPFITCSARLPVYVLLIGTFIPSYKIFGFIDSQGLALFFMYFLGSLVALIFAKIFRLSFFKSKSKSFFIEMPLYQMPKIKFAYKEMVRQGKVFLKKAGTIIFVLSIIIWFLSTYPTPKEELLLNKTEEQIASIRLENSFIGQFGKSIEPIIRPLGYDWKIGVGITVAFGARELFISALGTIYSLGDVNEESKSLKERLISEKDPITNRPIYTLALAWSLMIFFAFCCQCISTLAVVKKETGHWKYSFYMFIYMTTFAYISALITYNLVNILV